VLIAIATHLPNLQHLGLLGSDGRYTEVGVLALINSLTLLQQFSTHPYNTTAFLPALRERWQEISPGLRIYGHYVVSTRYFELIRWL
jgi:hypothetical protein